MCLFLVLNKMLLLKDAWWGETWQWKKFKKDENNTISESASISN